MVTLPDKILRGKDRQTDIEHLLGKPIEMTAPGERQMLCWVLPPWQRLEVWEQARKRAFVEGIFLGLGTGFYVAHQPDWDANGVKPMSGWLLDGQQRLSAIRDFVQDELTVFDGVRYSDLSLVQKRMRFLNNNFPYVEIPYTADENLLRELYMRLNFSGVAHTEADRALLQGAPAHFAHDLAGVEPDNDFERERG